MPDARLSEAQKDVVARDYSMQDGKLVIQSRGALVHYVLQSLQIDTKTIQMKPEAQQIVVANLDALQEYLFGYSK